MAGNVTKKNTETGGEIKKIPSSVQKDPIPTIDSYNRLLFEISNYDKKINQKINRFDKKIKEVEDVRKNLDSEIKKLEDEAKRVTKEFESLERRNERTSHFIQNITYGVLIAFVVTVILIGLDYFSNNRHLYEKFIDKNQEFEKEFYKKSEVDLMMSNLKNCLAKEKWLNPKCLE